MSAAVQSCPICDGEARFMPLGGSRQTDVMDCPRCSRVSLEWDAVVADAIEAEFRRWMPGLEAKRLRAVGVLATQRARFDLEDVDSSVREIRESADA